MTIKPMALAIAALMAAPALAQVAPAPTTTQAPAVQEPQQGQHGGVHKPGKRAHKNGNHRMLSSLSPAGQQIMGEALRRNVDPAQRSQLREVRNRIETLLSADKLDSAALKRAMEDERRLVTAQHQRRQESMLTAFQKLSAEDRKAFAATARAGRDRMEKRMTAIRERRANQPAAGKSGS